jgi:hypothetical protein
MYRRVNLLNNNEMNVVFQRQSREALAGSAVYCKTHESRDVMKAGSNVVSLRSAQTSFGASHPLEATETKKPARELAFS